MAEEYPDEVEERCEANDLFMSFCAQKRAGGVTSVPFVLLALKINAPRCHLAHCCYLLFNLLRRLVNDEYKIWKKNTPFLYGKWHKSAFCIIKIDRACWARVCFLL